MARTEPALTRDSCVRRSPRSQYTAQVSAQADNDKPVMVSVLRPVLVGGRCARGKRIVTRERIRKIFQRRAARELYLVPRAIAYENRFALPPYREALARWDPA